MSATDYTIDLRDIRFVLFEQMSVQESLKSVARYAEFDREIYETHPRSGGRHRQDRHRAHEQGRRSHRLQVRRRRQRHHSARLQGRLPQAIAEAGLLAAGMSPEFGGIGLPHAIDVAMHEMLTGACTAFAIYTGLSRAAANLLRRDFSPDWITQPRRASSS